MSLHSRNSFERSWKFACRHKASVSIAALLAFSGAGVVIAQTAAKDPGVRAGTVDSGNELSSVVVRRALTIIFSMARAGFRRLSR